MIGTSRGPLAGERTEIVLHGTVCRGGSFSAISPCSSQSRTRTSGHSKAATCHFPALCTPWNVPAMVECSETVNKPGHTLYSFLVAEQKLPFAEAAVVDAVFRNLLRCNPHIHHVAAPRPQLLCCGMICCDRLFFQERHRFARCCAQRRALGVDHFFKGLRHGRVHYLRDAGVFFTTSTHTLLDLRGKNLKQARRLPVQRGAPREPPQ